MTHTRQSRRRLLRAGCLGAVAMLALPLSSQAATPGSVTPTRDALAVAKAIADQPKDVTGASFVTIPGVGNPVAVATTPLGEFPTSGPSYAILSTGDATLASTPNTASNAGVSDVAPGAVAYRGVNDATTLKIDLNVAAGATCLSLRFRFYSEEFPEYVGSPFNDAFVAELDANTWSVSPTPLPFVGAPNNVVAPNNFAFDTLKNPITINSVGDTSVAPTSASGTTYDGATRRLRASVPITAGPHSLYLSIFDQRDSIYDSAVFVDRLTLSNLTNCVPGAAADFSAATPAGLKTLVSGLQQIPADSVFAPEGLLVKKIVANTAGVSRTRTSVVQVTVRDSRGYAVRGAPVFIRDAAGGLLQPVKEQFTDAVGVATFKLRPTSRLSDYKGSRMSIFVRARKPTGKIIALTTGRRLASVKLRP